MSYAIKFAFETRNIPEKSGNFINTRITTYMWAQANILFAII